MVRAALLGAVLVHPFLFLYVFVTGAVFGASPFFGGPPGSPPVFGWRGGLLAMESLLGAYVITMGLTPLAFSVAAAGLTVGLRLLVRRRTKPQIAWGTAGGLFGAFFATSIGAVVVRLDDSGVDLGPLFSIDREWTIAIGTGILGAVAAAALWGFGGWLPRTLGGGLGGVVGGCCVQASPETAQLLVSAFASGLVAILVTVAVEEVSKRFAAKPVGRQGDPCDDLA